MRACLRARLPRLARAGESRQERGDQAVLRHGFRFLLLLACLLSPLSAAAAADDSLQRWEVATLDFVVDVPGQLGGAHDARAKNPRYKLECLTVDSVQGAAERH